MEPNLVFASGVLVPQKIGGLEYFRGLSGIYPEKTTLFPPVSVLGSVGLRAQELADRIVKRFPAGAVHIIAHSMGGLDARCLIARNLNGLAKRVVSLSTISTPHHGSRIADLLLGHPTGLEFPFRDFLAQFASANAHALVDLTTSGAPGFIERDPLPGIRYFCYAGAGVKSALFFAPHVLIQATDGDNDGLVSVQSATWPTNLAEAPWADADHLAEVGYDLNRPDLATQFDYCGAIGRIVRRATS